MRQLYKHGARMYNVSIDKEHDRMRRSEEGGQARRTIRPERALALGFLLMILLGAALLYLPVSARNGVHLSAGEALFTATSAVCVTGLVAVDTGMTFTLFGQLVLLALIQAGGLGFMVFATMLMAVLGRRITLRSRLLLRESLNAATLSGLVKLSIWYGLLAMIIEGLGAALLCIRFVPMFGVGRGIYLAVWHAVSAFCNAGFDLFGGYRSLTGFGNDPLVLLVMAALIILGSTGFPVLTDMLTCRLRWQRFTLHTRLVLIMSGLLLVGGTAAIALLEWEKPNTLAACQQPGDRLLNAFFQSVTMRTAGFNSVPLASMQDATKVICILLMIVGANPASTGGGVKTTTVAVLLLAVRAEIRGEDDVTLLSRRLPSGLIRRALAVVTVAGMVLLTGTLAIMVLEGGRIPFVDVLFETASALATVGVTSAGTPELSDGSRLILAPMMYLGRVGPMTLAFALATRQGTRRGRIRYPEEHITIG